MDSGQKIDTPWSCCHHCRISDCTCRAALRLHCVRFWRDDSSRECCFPTYLGFDHPFGKKTLDIPFWLSSIFLERSRRRTSLLWFSTYMAWGDPLPPILAPSLHEHRSAFANPCISVSRHLAIDGGNWPNSFEGFQSVNPRIARVHSSLCAEYPTHGSSGRRGELLVCLRCRGEGRIYRVLRLCCKRGQEIKDMHGSHRPNFLWKLRIILLRRSIDYVTRGVSSLQYDCKATCMHRPNFHSFSKPCKWNIIASVSRSSPFLYLERVECRIGRECPSCYFLSAF